MSHFFSFGIFFNFFIILRTNYTRLSSRLDMGMLLEICEVEAGRLRDRFERCCDRETELLKGECCWERSSDSIDPVSISLDQLQPVLKWGVKGDFMLHADTSGTDVKNHTRFQYKKKWRLAKCLRHGDADTMSGYNEPKVSELSLCFWDYLRRYNGLLLLSH